MPEHELFRPIDDAEPTHPVDDRVANPEMNDDEEETAPKPIDAVEGLPDDDLERAHQPAPDEETPEK